MPEKDVKTIIIDAIATVTGYPRSKIEQTENLKDDLGVESLDAVTIVTEVEDQLNIKIPDELVYNLKTISELVEQAEKLLEKATKST